jgi:hypothetical protein
MREATLSPEFLENKHQLEIVRDARYVRVGLEDLEREGGLTEGYRKVKIKDEAIDCLDQGDVARVMKATQKGCFVFDINERAKNKNIIESSVLDQLKLGLKAKARPGEGQLFVRALVDPENKIIASGWWKQAVLTDQVLSKKEQKRRDPYKRYKADMRHMLHYGTSGEPMQYNREYGHFEQFVKTLDLPNCAFYDTLFGLKRFAAARMTLEIQEEMLSNNPNLQHIFLYILRSLSLVPSEKHSIVKFGTNWASQKFFADRGFTSFAHDFSAEGPAAERQRKKGDMARLTPAWDWLVGDAHFTRKLCFDIWNQIQKDFGFEDVRWAAGKPF